jgi:hypothetical protein
MEAYNRFQASNWNDPDREDFMVHRFSVAAFVAGLVVAGTAPVRAGWHEFCQRSALDWKRANAWPQPFVETDRLATCAPFVIMAENGWIHQSTLTNFHFDPATQQLTEAGRLKVQSILTQHPAQFRTVYVVQALKEQETTTRMGAVQDTIQYFAANGTVPDVRLTTEEPRGMPAHEVQAISTKFTETMPDPRLPPSTGASATQ